MNGLARRLKEAMAKSSLTYKEIEEKLELPEGSCEKWARGKEEPDTPTVKALADLLGVSADQLLFGVEKIGEMKAMFPADATPSPTPMSDWRFLIGVIMMFVGAAGLLLMYMMYAGEGIELALIFEVLGLPSVILAVIAVAGVLLSAISCISVISSPKKRKNKKKDKKQ